MAIWTPKAKVYDDSNYRELIGDGRVVHFGGEPRLLSAMPKPAGHNSLLYSRPFSEANPVYPRSEWSARVKENREKKEYVSAHQKFKSHNQGSFPTCWANGPAHAGTTTRVMQGLPLVYLSAMAIAYEISGGHSGGYEGSAIERMAKVGTPSVELWGNTDASNHSHDPAVIENRKHHTILEVYECHGFDEFFSACLLGFTIAISFNWWSHVISGGDAMEVESNSFGIDYRNNWGDDYGHKNEYGFGGYVLMREGKGTPSGGYALRHMLSSPI